MKTPRGFVLASVATTLGCGLPGSGGRAAAPPPPPPVRVPMVATLTAVTGARIYGTVRLEPAANTDTVRATVSVRGASARAQLPWEIRVGSCDAPGLRVGGRTPYGQISARADGTGELVVSLPVSLAAGQTYSANILASPTQRDRVVACGELAVP